MNDFPNSGLKTKIMSPSDFLFPLILPLPLNTFFDFASVFDFSIRAFNIYCTPFFLKADFAILFAMSLPLTPVCPGIQHNQTSHHNFPTLNKVIKISVIISDRHLSILPIKDSKTADESEEIRTLSGLISSIHFKAQRITNNSVEKTEIPL